MKEDYTFHKMMEIRRTHKDKEYHHSLKSNKPIFLN
jgi:hypothetical protein